MDHLTRGPLPALAAVLAALVLVGGFYGTLAGVLVGLGEAVSLPAIVLGVALACLGRGAAPLPAIAAWAAIGLVVALALRGLLTALGAAAWLPATGEDLAGPDLLLDAAWLLALSVLALRGAPGRVSGPMLAAIIVTTRIGAFVDLPAAMLREAATLAPDPLGFALFGVQVVAGALAAGVIVIGAGWLLARGARAAGRLVSPAALLGLLGLVAASGRLWALLGGGL